jgi:hypothetical protein
MFFTPFLDTARPESRISEAGRDQEKDAEKA